MRFPSVDLLTERAVGVARRFPWTIAVAVIAAAAAIVAVDHQTNEDRWAAIALVATLGLPATIGLALMGEARRWSGALRTGIQLAALAGLVAFYFAWPGPDEKHHAIRYVQLSASLHLAVAFLPFLGTPDSVGFWQYNRRLFLGFLRAGVFSAVLFVGLAIALGALDQLFGVDVDDGAYARIWFVIALVVNTWIFLAEVPDDYEALAQDREYPRALKVFSQYILTPLVFTYLVILLAYLVKIVIGAEWPSGWIGWLVTSVAVAGLLGFLLVHPLRSDPDEGWIRIYARWLFIGLIPASLMLLVAFWKRILPYGFTELRTLGFLLGFWLLGIAILFSIRRGAAIRIIPITLAFLLLVTLYGPVSLTSISLSSQENRLASLLPTAPANADDAREASAALRFLMDHDAQGSIESAIGQEIPDLALDTMPRYSAVRDSVATDIMALAGAPYVQQYFRTEANDYFYINAEPTTATRVSGHDWVVGVSANDISVRMAGADSVQVLSDTTSGVTRIRVGSDTLRFDVSALAAVLADSLPPDRMVTADRLRLESTSGSWRGTLLLSTLTGKRREDRGMEVGNWHGSLLLARPEE